MFESTFRWGSLVLLMALMQSFFINCGRPAKLPSLETALSVKGETISFNLLNENIFQPKCTACHANFATYELMMSSGTVIAFKPDQSSLYTKVASGQMPKGGTSLSVSEVTAIYEWIANGALNNASLPGLPNDGSGGGALPPVTGTPTNPGGGSGGGPGDPNASVSPTFAWLQSNVFTPRCIICHRGASAPGGYDLTSFESVLAGGRVVSGSPQLSKLFLRVDNDSMPPGGPALSPDVKQALAKWIENGAKNDAPPPGENLPPASTPPPIPPLEPKFASIMANIIGPKCLSCHSSTKPADGVVLQDYGNVMRQVSPFNPGDSELYDVIEDNEMPRSGAKLTFQEKETIRQWIRNGAINN